IGDHAGVEVVEGFRLSKIRALRVARRLGGRQIKALQQIKDLVEIAKDVGVCVEKNGLNERASTNVIDLVEKRIAAGGKLAVFETRDLRINRYIAKDKVWNLIETQ